MMEDEPQLEGRRGVNGSKGGGGGVAAGVHMQSAEIVVRSFSQVRQLIHQSFYSGIFGSNGNFSCVGLVIPCGNIVVILAFF